MLKILLVYDDFQEMTSVELMLKKIGFDVLGITSEFSLAEQLLSFNPQIVVGQGKSPKVSTTGVGKRLRESLRWDGQCVLIFHPSAKPNPSEILKMRMDVGLEYPVEPTKMVQVMAQLGGLDSNQLLDKLIKSMAQGGTDPKAAGASSPESDSKNSREAVFVSGGQMAPPESSQTFSNLSQDPEVHQPKLNQDLFPLDQEVESGEKSSNPFEMNLIQDPMLQELESLLQNRGKAIEVPTLSDAKRARNYAEILGTLPPLKLDSISRREAKTRMKDMVKDVAKETLRDQDDLRRDYVKALFKRST